MAEFDGRKIVLAMRFVNGETKSNQRFMPPPLLWLDAVDAQTGDTLWRHSLLFTGELSGYPPPVESGVLHDRKAFAIAYGNRLFGFDFLTGQPAWPDRQLEAKPPVVVRFADLLGNGQLEVLFVRETTGNVPYHNTTVTPGLSLVAQSLLSGKPLWEKRLTNVFERQQSPWTGAQFDWPLVVDLEGKGKPEVVMPFAGGMEVLEGATGKSRWQREMPGAARGWTTQPDRIVAGPAIDGDGYRELFAASLDDQAHQIYVEARSGREGRSLWSYTRSAISTGPLGAHLPPLRWWQTGADGWPLLVVTGAKSDQPYTGGQTRWSVILAASSGRVVHELNDFGAGNRRSQRRWASRPVRAPHRR